MAHDLINTWSIIINDNTYRLTPAFFTNTHIKERKRWSATFTGCSFFEPATDIMEIIDSINGKHFYWVFDTDIPSLVVKFTTESDMITACDKKNLL